MTFICNCCGEPKLNYMKRKYPHSEGEFVCGSCFKEIREADHGPRATPAERAVEEKLDRMMDEGKTSPWKYPI